MRGRLPVFEFLGPADTWFLTSCLQLTLAELQTVLKIPIIEVIQVVAMEWVFSILNSAHYSAFSSESEIGLQSRSSCVKFREHVCITSPSLSKENFECFRELFEWVWASLRSKF